MWHGSLSFETPMLWSVGFLVTFLFGGLTGVILASPPLDFHVTDSYFVVAHFHYVVFGTVVFAMFAGFYFWWPKFTGKMLDEERMEDAFLVALHRLPPDLPRTALARRRGNAPPLPGLPRRRRLHRAQTPPPPSAPCFSAPPHSRSSTTSGRPPRPVRASRRTTRGLRPVPGVGHSCPPPRHNFVTLPASAASRPPSTCTTRSPPLGRGRGRRKARRRRARGPREVEVGKKSPVGCREPVSRTVPGVKTARMGRPHRGEPPWPSTCS